MHPAAHGSDADTRLRQFLHDSVGGMTDVWRAHGALAMFTRNGQQTAFVSGPANYRVLFARQDAIHSSTGLPGPRNSAQRAFGRGLFGLNDEENRATRRLLQPLFSNAAVAGYHERLIGYVQEVTGSWRAGQTRDLYREMKAISLAMTGRMLFGVDDPDLVQRADEAFDAWLALNHRVGFASAFAIGDDFALYPRVLEAAEVLAELLRGIIAARRRNTAAGDDLLAPLLAAREAGELTETDLLGQVHSLFNASHHTTTAALTWTTFLIAQHPEVCAALVDELDGATQFEHLDLLDRVIKEGLRILPPVVYMSRVSAAPVRFGEVEVPAHAVIVGGVYTTLHDPNAFPHPERFDPQRWVGRAACPHSNVSFGGGARRCLGASLATHLMGVVLGTILPRFRLTVVPGARIDRHATLTLHPSPGIPVLIRDQDRNFSTSPVSGTIHDMVELPVATTGAAAA